jgi:hypothetical protein
MRLAIVAAALLAAAPASARPARLIATGSCTGVRDAVTTLAGRDPFDGAATLAIAVAAEPTHATIVVGGARRELTGESCAAIVDAVALAIVIVLAEPVVAPAMDVEPEAPPEQPAPAPPIGREVAIVVGARSTRSLEVGGRLSGERGSLALVLAVGGGEAREVGSGRIAISRGDVELSPCLRLARAAICAALAAGWIAGDGTGFPQNSTAVTPYAGLGLRAGWEQPLARWLAVAAYVEGRAALTSTRFFVDAMPAWTSSRLEGWAGIDLIAHLP